MANRDILKTDSTLKKIYAIEFFKGINRNGVMSLVVSLLIIYYANSEFELGGWTSLLSLLAIIAMYLFGKFYKKNQKRKLLVVSLIAILISSCCILYEINIITIIIYNIAYYVFMNIILKITEVNLFDYSNREPFKSEFNTEYFVFRELFLNTGRVLGYSILLIFVGITQNLLYLNIIFVCIVISIIMVIYISNKIEIKNQNTVKSY